MPNSPYLFIAAGTLSIMDASINVSMEPFRAFVGDLLPPSQRTTGFAMQSFFIGIGAIVASYLPYIFNRFLGISNTSEVAGTVSDNVKYSFYAGAFMLFITVMWTVFSTKEYPPDPEAAHALNLVYVSRMRDVVLPQAFKIALPPTVGYVVQIIKGTSLAAIIGFTEITRAGQIINNATFQPLQVFTTVAAIYFFICWPLSLLAARMERKRALALAR